MMKKVLIPVDFSDTSLNALNYAIRFLDGFPVEITLLHTYDVMSSSAFSMKMKSIKRLMKEDAEKEMEALVNKIRSEEPGLTIVSKLSEGSAATSISSLGDSGEYDFIIMGTKGASGIKEVFVGSVAGWVISKTKAPVMVIPGNYTYQPYKEIVFAISGDIDIKESVIVPLRKIATMHSSNINLLHISHEEEEEDNIESALEKVIENIEDFNPTVTYSPGDGDVNECLNNFILKQKAGLLCLVRGKKGYFNRLFFESVTLKQTFHTEVPLLILHNQ